MKKNNLIPTKNKPGLVSTVGTYFVIALIALMTIGLVVSRSLSDISSLATNTRDNILPEIINRQRTAVNFERLGRFAETVYRSDTPRIRRQYKLAAHVLSQDSVFENNTTINREVMNAYHQIKMIADLRDKQEHTNSLNTALILRFNPGKPAANAILGMKQGKDMIDLLFSADKAMDLDTLSDLEKEFTLLANTTNATSPKTTATLAEARKFFTQRGIALEANQASTKIWEQVNQSLEQLADNLSINAAITANDRFTIIVSKADQAIQTGVLAIGALIIALMVFLFLSKRDIVVPIIRYVQGLDTLGKGKKDLNLPEARLKELDDIRVAIERSARLMTQLADRTNALEESNASLELEVEERKRIQKELALSKELAETADRAKSDFLAGMSHEIRTPMNTILGMADLMLEAAPTPEQRQYIEICQSSGEMLLGVINDVLDLSKIEAGEVHLEQVTIDTSKFVERTREIVAARANQKGLGFHIDVAEDVPGQFIGDPTHLRQILVNLIDNGVKFTKKGKVRLSLQRVHNGKSVSVKFSVTDTGIGIPSEVQEHIFLRFTQADASTTRKYGGTGLGLVICRRLVELMGSTLHLKSAPGKGSTFFFTLDLSIPEYQKVTPTTLRVSERNLAHILSDTPQRILVAEDSDSNQALVELYFRHTACCLDFAADGKEALTKYKASPYDLVLMDIQMPIMDGYEATRQIRAFEAAQNMSPVPIVAVTANAFKEDQLRCLEAGCTEYLAKPITKAGLLKCVSRLLNNAG
ncbi:MAG: response regulator [Pseudodesulfovibrio sp.]|nr:response regulator [Pseudodesulfovibrio sp.]